MTYTKAVQQLSHHLTHSFLQDLYQYAKTNLPEAEIVERFLILTPDLLLGVPADPVPMSVDDPSPQVIPAVSTDQASLPNSQAQAQVGQVVTLGGLQSAEVTYASLAALPPSTSGHTFTLFQGQSSTPISAPAALSQVVASSLFQTQSTTPDPAAPSQLSNTSPTYAT